MMGGGICGAHAFVFLQFILTLGFHVHGLWIQDSSFVNILPTSVSPTPSVSVKFKGHCALLCQRDSTCKGFFYNEGSEECIKTPSVFLRNGDELSVPGSRYYRSTPVTCPSDGVYVLHEQSGTCFQLNDVAMNWTDARDACSAAHGSLANLDTFDKEETLMEFFLAGHPFTQHYYIGGYRPYSAWDTYWPNGQPDFRWLSGQPVDYSGQYWYGEDPNGPINENVLSLVYFSGDWFLVDFPESYSLFYVCEYALF